MSILLASTLRQRRRLRQGSVLGQFASPDFVLDRQRRSTYREYASRRWLPRASSGSQLGPVTKAKLPHYRSILFVGGPSLDKDYMLVPGILFNHFAIAVSRLADSTATLVGV